MHTSARVAISVCAHAHMPIVCQSFLSLTHKQMQQHCHVHTQISSATNLAPLKLPLEFCTAVTFKPWTLGVSKLWRTSGLCLHNLTTLAITTGAGWQFSQQLYAQFWLELTSSITFFIPLSMSQVERTDSNYVFQRRGDWGSERPEALQRSHWNNDRGIC